jgi:GDPmannose 4,6-dehydratase
MKALIFGANGQDGYYLHELCKLKGIDPIGIARSGNGFLGNVADYGQVEQLIKQYLPIYIFHLAANSTTRHDALFENHETISTGTLNILEAVKKHSPTSKVFITGSGLQFRNTGNPISEHNEFEANSAYSVARIHSVYAARYYRSLGIRAYVGYLFHHESPHRKASHVSKMIALAAQRIAAGSDEMLEIGDIAVRKEWTYARDVMQGIMTLVEQDEVFEATVGSGLAYSIQDWLEQCFTLIGRDWHDHVKLRPGFVSEYKQLVSNPETINTLGWHPVTTFADLARMMMLAEKPDEL